MKTHEPDTWKDKQCVKWWTIEIKFCVLHNLLKADFTPHTITVVLWNSWTSASQEKKWSNSTKMKHSRSCFMNYSMHLSLSLTQNEWTKNFSLWEFFIFEIFWNFFFSCMRDNETYTLLNRHSVLVITVVHRLTDLIIR